LVWLTEFHADQAHFLEPSLFVANEGHRVVEKMKFDALFLGVFDLFAACGHFLLGAPIEDAGFFRTQAQGNPHRIKGGVAAADYRGSIADIDLFVLADSCQEIDAGVAALEIFAGNIQVVIIPRAHAEKYDVKPGTDQGSQIKVKPHLRINMMINAKIQNAFDFPVENLFGQPVFWYAVADHTTEFGHGLENGRMMPESAKEIRCG